MYDTFINETTRRLIIQIIICFYLDYVLNYQEIQEAMKGKIQILFASKPIQAMNNKVGPLIYVNKA